MSDEFKSKLQRRKQVIRGMGSGYSENQRMAGSKDPERSAKEASMDKNEYEDQEDQKSLALEELERKRELIMDLVSMGFKLESSLDTPEEIEKVYEAALIWEEAENEKVIPTQSIRDDSISPDSHLYDPLMDTARRKYIEGKCDNLDFDHMVFRGYCDQEVVVRENFNIVLRTLSTQQGLWVEMFMTDIGSYSVQYGRHWLSLTQLAISLQTINGKAIGPDLDGFYKTSQKDEFKKAIDSRMEFIGKLPQIITDDLIIQYVWFCGRVRKLMSGDIVKKVGN